ncbi:hypothetical protein SAMN03159309_01266 [Pseudomonas sp. NFACC36]|nr:hypothetical protein SAMN03159309_01266 [Pseudomonas sp. NFACC36]
MKGRLRLAFQACVAMSLSKRRSYPDRFAPQESTPSSQSLAGDQFQPARSIMRMASA